MNKSEVLKAKHILVTHEYEASDILRKISHGENFEKLAQDFSLCSSSAQGGDLGEFRRGQMVPAFEKAVLGLKPNEISSAIKTQFGYHIIKRV